MRRDEHSAAALLAAVQLFAGVSPEAIAALAERSVWHCVDEGEMLFTAGQRLSGLFVLASGRLQLDSTRGRSRGSEAVMPGRTVCEECVFADQAVQARATAASGCELLEIPRWVLASHLEQDPAMALMMLASLSARVQELTREIRRRERPQARERLVDYLLQQGGAAEGSADFTLNVRKASIAAKLRVTPEHLSRLLRELRVEGLVRVDKQRISVPDVTRLAQSGTEAKQAHGEG